MTEWRTFMAKYMPDAEKSDSSYLYAYSVGSSALQMLKQCDGNFSRENIMNQVTSLAPFQVPTLLPGCIVSTSAENWHPIRHMQMQRWTGTRWERFGEVIEGAGA